MMTVDEFTAPINSMFDAERADAMEALLRGELPGEDYKIYVTLISEKKI